MSEFKPGDLVTLCSGGPVMTVESEWALRKLRCVWFADGRLEIADISAEVLRHYSPEREAKLGGWAPRGE